MSNAPIVILPGDGTTTQFDVPFPYLRKEHVKVYFGGDSQTVSWVSPTRVETEVPTGLEVTVRRETPTAPIHVIQDNRPTPAQHYNEILLQAIYVAEERPGIRGQDGPTGPQGVQGPFGPQGNAGIQGPIGPQGPQGPQGLQGIQGTRGERGLQGEQGAQGLQGPRGEKGEKGDSGSQGVQGLQGPLGERGLKGDQGERGVKGDTGAAGASFTVNASGPFVGRSAYDNASINFSYLATDTGNLYFRTSSGWGDPIPFGKGEKGDKGDKGDTGAKGDKGDTGAKGDQGIQGIQGVKGDVGPEGPEGPEGAQGVQGIQGIQGERGDNDWNSIVNKPSTFPPSAHDHNADYYTKTQIDNLLSAYAPKANPTFTGTITAVNIDASGAITAEGNISAYT